MHRLKTGSSTEYADLAQRIERAFAGEAAPADTVVPAGDGVVDLRTPPCRASARSSGAGRSTPSTRSSRAPTSLAWSVEAWYDHLTESYLNDFPRAAVQGSATRARGHGR